MNQSADQSEAARGASLVVVILYVCLLAITLYTAAYLWVNKPAATSASSTATLQTYTDSAGRFTLQYPTRWHLTLGRYIGDGPVPDWSKESRPITLMPPDAPDPSAGVVIEPFTAKETNDMVHGISDSSFDTVTLAVIGGKPAYYDRLNFVDPDDTERYVDSNYLIPDGDNSLWITFRENYYQTSPHASWSNPDVNELKTVISSITFLKQ